MKNGVNKPTKVRGDGYKMVNMGELFANPIIRNMEMARVPMTDSELKNSLLQPEDLLFARQSLTIEGAGKCSLFIGDDEPYTFEGHLIRARVNREIAFPRYIYYYFNSFVGKSKIETLVHVTAAAGIRSSDLSNLKIELPPLPAQRRIVEILSALDEKIELNRQTNATLEAITQSIFKEWFVEFNFPGATGQLVESELGMIPAGWKVGTFHDILSVEIGGDWGQDQPFDGGVSVISLRGTDLEQLKSFGFAPNAPRRWVKNSSIDKRNITNKDILIAGSGLGPIGRSIYFADSLQDLYDYPITYSNFCKKLRASTPAHAIYAERLLESIYVSGEMRQYFTGTSIPNLDVQSLLKHKVLIPEEKILKEYYKVVGKEKFDFLFRPENSYLATTRDVLLPKLMSGEIQIEELEE